MKRLTRPAFWLPFVLVAALGLWPIITGNAARREMVFSLLMAIILASSLNILLGYTGYVSFGHVVFFGIGGYIGMYCMDVLSWHLALAVLAGGLSAGVMAFLLGTAILRLKGAYFALATIGVNEAARAFANAFQPFGGPIGMTLNFHVYDSYGGAGNALWMTFYATLILALIVILASTWVKDSKFGLGLMSIRENEGAAEVMGVDAPASKTWAYVVSAIFPGILGALFFFKNANIEPGDAFQLQRSVEMIVMVMLGGLGTVLGPVLGGAGYNGLRGFLIVSPLFKNVQLAVAGTLLLLIVLFVPAGVVGWLRQHVQPLRSWLE
jgi:branched-chain amino acid transport system permease protein